VEPTYGPPRVIILDHEYALVLQIPLWMPRCSWSKKDCAGYLNQQMLCQFPVNSDDLIRSSRVSKKRSIQTLFRTQFFLLVEEQRLGKQHEHAEKAQAWAIAKILHDQAVLSLLTMPNKDSLPELAREYLNLRCEEMSKLRWHLAEEKEVAASAAMEAKRLAAERDAEVEVATRNRVPPPPQ
jgi:hypothetical protein